MTRIGFDGEPIPDDYVRQECPLCGNVDYLPPGWECRRVKQARAEGKLPPKRDVLICRNCGNSGVDMFGNTCPCQKR